MNKTYSRTPKNYNGTGPTSHRLGDLLSGILAQVGFTYEQRPDLILAAWPEIIGFQLAPMTEAVSFYQGVLHVKVKNSTLHSLLNQNDKPRILNVLRRRFPNVQIKSITFRIG